MGGEHGLCMPRREAPTGVGRTRLHEDRPALRRARQIEGTRDLVTIALVVDGPNALRQRVAPKVTVIDDGVFGPAVPQCLDHGHELFAAGVAVCVADLPRATVVSR